MEKTPQRPYTMGTPIRCSTVYYYGRPQITGECVRGARKSSLPLGLAPPGAPSGVWRLALASGSGVWVSIASMLSGHEDA